MLKDDVTYRCIECGTETVFKVPRNEDWDMFAEDRECPECGCTALEVSEK